MIMRNIFEEDFSLKKRIAAGNIRLIRSPVLGGMFYDLMRTNFAGRAHGDKNVYAATDFYYCSAGRIICFGDWVENIDQIKEKSLRGEFLVSRNPRGIFLIDGISWDSRGDIESQEPILIAKTAYNIMPGMKKRG